MSKQQLDTQIVWFLSWILITSTLAVNSRSGENLCLCPDTLRGRCYVSFDEPTTYRGATEQCESVGGSLVKLDPVDQVTDIIQAISGNRTRAWIGLDDIEEEDDYRWVADRSRLDQSTSKFRSVNTENDDCVGMDPEGNFQFADCNSRKRASCDLSSCNGTCECYNVFVGEFETITQFQDRCIFTVTGQRSSFEQLRLLCKTLGKSMSSIDGRLVQLQPWKEIKEIIMKHVSAAKFRSLTWVGLTDMEEEGRVRFTSVNGSVLTSDFRAGNNRDLNCATINPQTRLWEYAQCSEEVPFICQTPTCPVMTASRPHSTERTTGTIEPTTSTTETTKGVVSPLLHFHMMAVVVVASTVVLLIIIGVLVTLCCWRNYYAKCSKRSLAESRDISAISAGDHNSNMTMALTCLNNGSPASESYYDQVETRTSQASTESRRLSSGHSHQFCADSGHHHYDDGYSENDDNGPALETGNGQVAKAERVYEDVEDIGKSGGESLCIPQMTSYHGSLRQPKRMGNLAKPWNSFRLTVKTADMKWRELPDPRVNAHEPIVDAGNTDNPPPYSQVAATDDVYYDVDESESATCPLYDDIAGNEKQPLNGTEMVYNELYDSNSPNDIEMVYNDLYDGTDSIE